ncbi:hypothetical protein MAR_001140 [Mya arenaria]|uniref:Male-enhanced antigen 1 n=1 Tax=Mya arenaria TaxID=6604 RepID=A0ABY7FE55_MYAAR|nr:hypothetical protein MAR_001140 [Mya arenaria]
MVGVHSGSPALQQGPNASGKHASSAALRETQYTYWETTEATETGGYKPVKNSEVLRLALELPIVSTSDIDNLYSDHPDVIINADVSDTESGDEEGDMEEMGYHGYQALGQGPLNGEASEDSDEESEEESDTEQGAIEAQASLSGTPGVPAFPEEISPDLQGQYPDYPHSHVEKVKSVMTAIQIPMANIPDWAKSLSEDQWQGHVDKLVKTETSPKQEINKSKDMKYGDSRTKEELNEFTSEKNSNISGPSEISGFDVNENT